MTIIALFVSIIEIAFGVAFSKVPTSLQSHFFWFMAIFAGACLVLFFIVLIFQPQNLYGPSDFRSDEAYLNINRRIDSLDKYAKLIDQKIESMPLYRYPKLTECAKVLFLRIYDEEKGIGIRSAEEIIGDQQKNFSAQDMQIAIQELVDAEWLCKNDNSIAPTPEGQKAHQILSQFVYARYR